MTNSPLIVTPLSEPEPYAARSKSDRSLTENSAGTLARSTSQTCCAVAASLAGGDRNSLTSVRPLLNVHTRRGSRVALTPSPTFLPIAFEASSVVSRVHGSIEPGVALAPSAPPELASGSLLSASDGLALATATADAVGGTTATWLA